MCRRGCGCLCVLRWSNDALSSDAADAACRQGNRAPALQRRMASRLPCTATCAFTGCSAQHSERNHLATLPPLQDRWDAFDPAMADGFAGWLPGFYDAVEAAADTESRWLQGVLPAQVIISSTFTLLTAWSQMLAVCSISAGMTGRASLSGIQLPVFCKHAGRRVCHGAAHGALHAHRQALPHAPGHSPVPG